MKRLELNLKFDDGSSYKHDISPEKLLRTNVFYQAEYLKAHEVLQVALNEARPEESFSEAFRRLLSINDKEVVQDQNIVNGYAELELFNELALNHVLEVIGDNTDFE